MGSVWPAVLDRAWVLGLALWMGLGMAGGAVGGAEAQESRTVDPPARVLVRPDGGEQLRGWVTRYDGAGFDLRDPSDRVHRVAWRDLPADRELWVHERILGDEDAEAWYALVARLVKREDGEASVERAAARLLRIDGSLEEKVARLRAGEEVPFVDPPLAEEGAEAGDGAGGGGGAGGVGEPETPAAGAEPAGGPMQTGQTQAEFWGELSPQVMEQSVEALKQEAEKVQRSLGQRLELYEDANFLVYSDLNAGEARRWVGLLDDMYDRLLEMFDLEKGRNIFRGKCLIYIFRNEQDYYRYCSGALGFPGRGTAGVCESRGDGMAVVAFFRQRDTLNFAHVLVHESAHAFVHRYRSFPQIPSWINEGIAEYVAHALVDNRGFGESDWSGRNADARLQLQRAGSLRGMLDVGHIDGWQYPVAYELCQFMVRQSATRYRAFIDAIKDGKPWEQALNEDYGLSRHKLVEAFGESLRIRGLQP